VCYAYHVFLASWKEKGEHVFAKLKTKGLKNLQPSKARRGKMLLGKVKKEDAK